MSESQEARKMAIELQQLDADRRTVDALCDLDAGLSTWEIDFIESIAARVTGDDPRPLTDRQREIAEEILERLE